MILQYEKVKEKIEAARAVTILSHVNPDADAIGTSLGIYHLLKKHHGDKRIEIANASKVLPRYLDFLPDFSKIKHKIEYEESLVIACDCGSVDRLGFELSGREIINIDHHLSNDNYGSINVVVPGFASSSQVAYTLFKKMYQIDAQCATCFYTALLSDTRFFTTSSVNERVFTVAKELISLGANPSLIAQNFTQRKALSALRILERALASLTLHSDARIATLHVTAEDIIETGVSVPDMDGIVDYGKSLTTVQIALFAMELEDGIRISMRSKGADVSKVASTFGGGGHKVASGCTLPKKGVSIEAQLEDLIKEIEAQKLLT